MRRPSHTALSRPALTVAALVAAVLGACSTPAEVMGPPQKDLVLAVTAGNELLRFNAGQPQRVLERRRLGGLAPGESLIGLDFRIARGQLYGLGSTGRVYTIDPATGDASPLPAAAVFRPEGTRYGFDFNPTVDRIRVVGPAGTNLRLHPDTGAQVDGSAAQPGVQSDGTLFYRDGDVNAGRAPRIVAAGYTYNKLDETITSNFAIDASAGILALQGTHEGVKPAVSPNTGQLSTVGALGIGRLDDASFDIADVSGKAYLAAGGGTHWRFYEVDLDSGRARFVGTLASSDEIRGIAIEP